jgi:Matrixin
MARLALIVCVASMLLLPAVAGAHTGGERHRRAESAAHRGLSPRRALLGSRAAGEPVALATTLAERYWGATPCAGRIAVLVDQPLPAGMEPTTDGWVTFESSLGADDLQAPASTYSACTISLAHWQWPTRLEMAGDWKMFCLTVVHEMGHLLGHPHSLAPGSVMAPVFTNESNVPPICSDASAQVEAAAGLQPIR